MKPSSIWLALVFLCAFTIGFGIIELWLNSHRIFSPEQPPGGENRARRIDRLVPGDPALIDEGIKTKLAEARTQWGVDDFTVEEPGTIITSNGFNLHLDFPGGYGSVFCSGVKRSIGAPRVECRVAP